MSKPDEDKAKDGSSQAGRIVHDSRGNAVWNWNKGGDSSSTASTSKMLRKLDLANLRVEDAAQPEKADGTDAKKISSGYGQGYNPYDRTAPVRVTPPGKKPSR
jgi:hypothetical protein